MPRNQERSMVLGQCEHHHEELTRGMIDSPKAAAHSLVLSVRVSLAIKLLQKITPQLGSKP